MDAMLCCELARDERFVDLEPGTSIDNYETGPNAVAQTNSKCTYSTVLDCNNDSTSNNIVDNGVFDHADIKESYVHSLMDLSDLGLSCDDHVPFDDCLCFETCSVQREDLLDPLLELRGASFSISSNDSVQLLKDNGTDTTNNNSTEAFSLQRFLSSKEASSADNVIDSSENYNFYHVFELIGKTLNNNEEKGDGGGVEEVVVPGKKPRPGKPALGSKKKEKLHGCAIAKGRSYLPNFKQRVLDYAASHTLKDTATKFKINCNTLTEWSQASKRLLKQNKSTRNMPGSACDPKTEVTLTYTPVSKTEPLLITDEVSGETDSSRGGPAHLKPDLHFVQWITQQRQARVELTREMVYRAACLCLQQAEPAPDWFHAYITRFDKVLKGSGAAPPYLETDKYIMYPHNFKTEVALYASLFTKNSAARAFNVPRKGVFDWCNLMNMESPAGAAVAGSNRIYTKQLFINKLRIYSELHEWCELQQASGTSPTSCEIKEKAREMFREGGIPHCKFSEGWVNKFCKRSNIKLKFVGDGELVMWVLGHFDRNIQLSHQQITDQSCQLIGTKTFKGSKGWTIRFLKRHSNLLQEVPTIRDPLPNIAQRRIQQFHQNLHVLLDSGMFAPSTVAALDEIPIMFNYTRNEKLKLPLLRSCGFKNCQAVVLLCVLASGHVLPPVVVLKDSIEMDRDLPTDIPVLYSANGVVDAGVLERWQHFVWFRHLEQVVQLGQPSVLIMDVFDPHQAPAFQQRLSSSNTKPLIIPDGCSTQLLPHTVNITNTFQECIRKEWSQVAGEPGGRCQYPEAGNIVAWVRAAHEALQQDPNSIIHSFKLTGILR